MRPLGRRLHFQLMPLLDLLLIMIFSLYLEVRERSERREAQADRKVAAAEAKVESERQALRAERKRVAERETALEAENKDLRGRVEDVVEQQRRAADLMAELFDVPANLVDEALRPRPGGAARSAAETERLRQKFKELAAARGPAVIEHLLTHEELRKRADVWTLRIRANGEIVFSSGDRTQSFRAATADEFATRLYERYKTLPQPKGIVVLLVSYGDARADVRQAVLAGLPEAVRRLREDSLGRTQFEYAVLGFLPEEGGGTR